jgi:hypothetical protein
MSDEMRDTDETISENDRRIDSPDLDAEGLGDEEKIMAGRFDVNYPAMLTKDVPGG